MLTVTVCGEEQSVRPVSAQGLGLFVAGAKGGNLFVLEHQAADRAAFWAAWKRCGGEAQGLVWESGKEFRPPM